MEHQLHLFGQRSTTGAPGSYVECHISCSPRGALCDGFEAAFNCDNDHPERPRGERVTQVTGDVIFPSDPFCYTPLYKEGEISLNANISINGSHEGGSVSHSFSLDARVRQTMTGVGSCYTFRKLLGVQAAYIVAPEIQKVIDNN